MSPRLFAYLDLERAMLALDDRGDEVLADRVRDAMDPLWYGLTDDEHAWLDARASVELEPARVPRVLATEFVPPSTLTDPSNPPYSKAA